MKKVLYLTLLTVFIVAIAAAGVACGGNQTSNTPVNTSPTGTTTGTSSVATTPANPDEVIITDENGFAPATLTVPAGTKVTWFNKSSQRVWVTSDSKKPDTGLIAIGTQVGYTFNDPGTYEYYNLYHKDIKGTIIVQ
jgi:plastocyanin